MTANLKIDSTSTPAVPRTAASTVRFPGSAVVDSGGGRPCLPLSAMRPGARMKMQQMDIPEGTFVGNGQHRSGAAMGKLNYLSISFFCGNS